MSQIMVLLKDTTFRPILSCIMLRCVCLEDKERWSTQQLLQHIFIISPQVKVPLMEESPDGKLFFILH